MPSGSQRKLILFLGSMAGIGFVPVASGTITVAVWGIPLFFLLQGLHWGIYVGGTLVFLLVSVWLSEQGDRILREKDSRKMVVDEIVGYLVAVFTLPFTWQTAAISFFLERAIDIAKVPPANWIEQKVAGGWGIVLDDVVAGLYTLAIMRTLIYFLPEGVGL